MFLSRVELGPRAESRESFWREVSKPYGAHQALWQLLSKGPVQRRDFLFRAEDAVARVSFLVLSSQPPDASGAEGLWSVATKPFAPVFVAGQRLGFKLRASPVVRRGQAIDGRAHKRVQRHDVVMDELKKLVASGQATPERSSLIREAGIRWLRGQAGRSGFRLVETAHEEIGDDGLFAAMGPGVEAVRVDGYRQHRIVRRGEEPIRFSTLDFEGVLEVTDPVAFLGTIARGFGPQKAFGCGLMLLRRA